MVWVNRRTSFAAISVLAAFAACGPAFAAGPASPGGADPLRICADPANLPFSSDDASKPGVYVELGEALGKALGRPVTYVWYRTNFGGRAVRVTMLANQCDATIGLPKDSDFMGPRVIFSKPLFRIGYALVSAPDFDFAGLDSLKGRRVAVQFKTTPQNMIAPRDDITAVTVLSPEEGMKALADGRADVALIWGPTAGYLNSTAYAGKYRVTPVDGPALSWPTAVGFAKQSAELREKVDAVLPALEGAISELLTKYGFPNGAPVKLGALDRPGTVQVAAMGESAFAVAQTSPATAPTPVTATAEAPTGDHVAGKQVFNGTCAHCHGPDAVQSEKKIDLRRLTIRYGEDMHKVYSKTVRDGRPSKGMPAWKDVFTDTQFDDIFAYLQTVQTQE